MKNVAKCDTWCELQNPVNHRVFERKLRPRPPGRGHGCLGVTRTSRSGARARAAGRGDWPPAARRAEDQRPPSPGAGRGATSVGPATRRVPEVIAPPPREGEAPCAPPTDDEDRREKGGDDLPSPPALAPQPQVRRGHPLSLSISISGGKETYEDSPSNGERTGKSPA
ncbi:hypothetical protein IHE45_14G051800 [Dioscorea alata]|uniref:Uncharacterized protein n=1 Tax=Dioscorea alata TaxID=55571 RepID=A0ACB7URN2_DIOAL|nr:hypothetical protein IHE45_14G051800 [Dioscorea alata]